MAATMVIQVKGATLQGVLEGMRITLNDFAEKEMKAINGWSHQPLEYANQVSLAIAAASICWDSADALSQIAEELKDGDLNKARLEKLRAIVKLLKPEYTTERVNLPARVRAFRALCQMDAWQAQCEGSSEQYYYAEKGKIDPSFIGRFKNAYNKENARELQLVGGREGAVRKLIPDKPSDRELHFRIVDLVSPDAAIAHCQFVPVVLKAEYFYSKISWKTYTATFNYWIGVFPLSPGKIALTTHNRQIIDLDRRHHISPTMCLKRQHFQTAEPVVRNTVIKPSEGYRFIKDAKAKIIINEAETEVEPKEGSVLLEVTLKPEDNQVDGHVEFDEEKDVYGEVPTDQQIALKWGESVEFKCTRFKAVFDSFDGKKYEIDAADVVNPYLKIVKVSDDTYRLVAQTPQS